MVNWLLHLTGIDDVSGRWYGFWSGIGSDLTILAAPLVLYRKHNCHESWCWRIGHFKRGDYLVCRRHYPPIRDLRVSSFAPADAEKPPSPL